MQQQLHATQAHRPLRQPFCGVFRCHAQQRPDPLLLQFPSRQGLEATAEPPCSPAPRHARGVVGICRHAGVISGIRVGLPQIASRRASPGQPRLRPRHTCVHLLPLKLAQAPWLSQSTGPPADAGALCAVVQTAPWGVPKPLPVLPAVGTGCWALGRQGQSC